MHFTAYLGLVMMLFACKGNAISCYNCTWNDLGVVETGHAANCKGPLIGSEHAVQCPEEKPFCYTQTVRTVLPEFGIDSITLLRRCSEFGREFCLDLEGESSTCVQSCTTDLCNTGGGGLREICIVV